jgi:putative ABC transport system permease protein
MIRKLAWKSLLYRRWISVLLVISLGSSVFLALAVERIRWGARESFSEVISQADLLVGARTGPINLLLYTIFGMGNATNTISLQSYEKLRSHPAVDWTIPFSLGDSHKGFRVIATTEAFYKHYRFRGDRRIELRSGSIPASVSHVVLGAQVAQSLGYKVGEQIILSHGMSGEGPDVYQHEDQPFQVVGILMPTNTPIDWSLYITLEGMEWIHEGWQEGQAPAATSNITSFLVRMKNRIDSVYFQRDINQFKDEPLMAIAPGVTLMEFWNSFRFFEKSLQVISIFVALISLLGLFVVLMISIELRQREMLILRTIGLNARKLFALVFLEVGFLTLSGVLLGIIAMLISFFAMREPLEAMTGVAITLTGPSTFDVAFVLSLLILALLSAIWPAWRLYRQSLL